MEIVPGVHRVDGVRGSNVYLIINHDLLLIDTGLPGNATKILNYIRQLGRDPDELACIVITHGHIDHAGSAAELRAFTTAKTIAHKDEVMLDDKGEYLLKPGIEITFPKLRQVLSSFSKLRPVVIDSVVTDGQILPYMGGLRVIHTPGHTIGSMCLLLDPQKVVFTGDTIINNEDRLSRPLPFRANRNQSELSLQKLNGFDFNICCFGHGPPLLSAKKNVIEFTTKYPRSPLLLRVLKNQRRIIRFMRNMR